MKRYLGLIILLSFSAFSFGSDPSKYDLPNVTMGRSECSGPKSCEFYGANPNFSKKISSGDLKCPPYEITKPGSYYLTKEIIYEATIDGEPLIKILSDDVILDFQGFAVHQDIPAAQMDGTDQIIKSNIVEIGDGTNLYKNITLGNGILTGASGIGILINPNIHNVLLKSLSITHCLAGGIAIAGDALTRNTKNIDIECCSITNHGNYKIVGKLNGTYLDSVNFPLIGSISLGTFGILTKNCEQISIKGSEILNCGASDLDFDAIGIYCEDTDDIEILKSTISGHTTAADGAKIEGFFAKGIFLNNCKKGFIDCCWISANEGNGVFGIDMINSSVFHISNSNIFENSALGDLFGDAFCTCSAPCICPPRTTTALWDRCSPLSPFTHSGTNVNMLLAYADYKVGSTIPCTSTSCISNWQYEGTPPTPPLLSLYDNWTKFMQGFHSIDKVMEPYTYQSKAYGVRLFNTSYVVIDSCTIIDTVAQNSSAFGILIDQSPVSINSCASNGANCSLVNCLGESLCNTIKYTKIQGTKAFANSIAPNINYTVGIESFFGDILNELNSEDVRAGETISMIGRAVGIEIRNGSKSNGLHNNLVKSNSSEYSFGAGIFLNRSTLTDIVGNRIESNYGFDNGFGLLNRVVDPTDITASTVLFANGTVSDKNINYAFFYKNGGIFTIKHAFTSDLGLLNNLSTRENIQIFFDEQAQANLPLVISTPDIDSGYVV